MFSVRTLSFAVVTVLGLLALTGARVESAGAVSTDLFFSEYVEGTSNNKALEIYNGTGAAVNLGAGGYAVRMYFNGNATAGLGIALAGTVGPGDVFVLAHSSASLAILAEADQTNGAGWFNGDDAVVLTKGVDNQVVDVIGQIGFDPGTEWGTGVTSTADNTLRRKGAIEAGDPNGADSFDPAAEWNGFATDTFDGLGSHTIEPGDSAPVVASTIPTNGASDVSAGSDLEITFSEPVSVSGSWYTISCATSAEHSAVVSGGPTTYTLNPAADFASNESCTVTIDDAGVQDVDANDPPDMMTADHSFSFTTTLQVTQIGQVQGAGHFSPFAGELVKVEGVVIAERGSNVWLQDPTPDLDDATSEAILVFGSAVANAVVVGDNVHVRGTVTEFRPGCTPSCEPTSSAFSNLTITELASPGLGVTKLGTALLPAATIVGAGGRVPPTEVIENDSGTGNVETGNTFDPAQDGIDFYETLESMLVQVNNPVVVGPRNNFGEILVLADNGAGASVRTARGGILVRDVDPGTVGDYRMGDFNPERIMLDDLFVTTPTVDVADRFSAAAGVMTYDFANYKIAVSSILAEIDGGLQREVTRAPSDHEVVVGTYNVENLDPSDGSFARHADLIVNHLRSPDVIAIEEIQDNDGATNTAVTDASVTWNMLIAAIQAAGGPTYEFRQIDPVDDQDGGEPGGNIRVGFLFRADRGVNFIDRPGGDSITPTTVVDDPSGPQLSFSPGRVDPKNPAYVSSRKPLAGEFRMRGKKVFVVALHLSSKGGDQPLFGRFQPPARSSEVARHAQAESVNEFVDEIVDADPNADVIVLGDVNDFDFSETVQMLEGGVLTTLMDTLPFPERYSYVFEGNSQVLDQILVSNNLFANFPIDYDPVHVNAEFADQASDHDPQVARLDLRGRPGSK
jgi:predicted extracellular nuclease